MGDTQTTHPPKDLRGVSTMKKTGRFIAVFFVILLFLSGCTPIGDKTMNISAIYGAMSVISLLLLLLYRFLIRNRSPWFYLLFSSVLFVNIGYFLLSVSGTLNMALASNRISYFGSVFLPFSMLMIILKTANLSYRKWLPVTLVVISIIVFLIAASPGYLDIYYKSVSIEKSNGMTMLLKEYGPLHSIYLFYLLIYFSSMVTAILYATVKKKIKSNAHSVIIAITAFVNIGVWLLEQLSRIEFEFLSVSYIISELFLLGLYLMLQSEDAIEPTAHTTPASDYPSSLNAPTPSQSEFFTAGLDTLTNTERKIYELYLEGSTTKDIMAKLNIKENTLKFHNKNLYGKLGVSSRKELVAIAVTVSNKTSE